MYSRGVARSPHTPSPRGEGSTATLLHDAPPIPLGAVLRVIGADAMPPVFRLRAGSCILGAGKEAHILVSERTVSRKHVAFTLVPDGVVVEDLGSRNGTFYLGQRVEKIVLALGSRVRVGSVEVAIDADVDALTENLSDRTTSYRGLVGASIAMRHLFAVLKRLEGSIVPVLVHGESGVGKELVVRAIHEGSARAQRPLLVVNCGGIAKELVGSELFGHKRGAFTGAMEQRTGAFEAADGGTLFLDEVGELPLEAQPALLRALESGEVRPVGETATKKVSVRVIAATNRDLEEEVKAGRFRGDLYYRLAVVKLVVPPLRERPEDIVPLASLFARAAGLASLPHDVIAQLSTHTWPGNARELRNAVEAWVAVGALPGARPEGVPLLDQALDELATLDHPYADQKEYLGERFTRIYLHKLMRATRGNQSEAARISGLQRTYLGKLLVKHGIKG
jgi:transcriptional regulator with GAF, ATPase, and Fis domain